MKKILSLGVIIFLFGLAPFGMSNYIGLYDIPASLAYTTRGPIIINSNADFASFPGSGIEGDPYLIDGYAITDSVYVLISISNTDKYFKISNNYLDNVNYAVEGIYLYNVLHGEISNNIIVNSRHAIYLDNSNDVKVYNNNISSIAESGVRLNYSDNNNILSNNISECEYNGIWLNQSSNNAIDKNDISQITNTSGIWIKSYSDNNTINNNTVSDGYHGILVSSSNNNNITNNFLKNNVYGIYASSKGYLWEQEITSDSNNFKYNTLYNNTYYGMGLEGKIENSSISYNMFLRNYVSSNSQAFDNGTNNLFTNNFWDEWTGPDTNPLDGYVDDNYLIDGSALNVDSFALADFVSELDFNFLSRPRIYTPVQGDIVSGVSQIRWSTAIDAQNKQVNYSLYYSPDNGQSWIFIIEDYKLVEYFWNTYILPNGSLYLLKIIASTSSGLTTQYITDDVFSIENSDHSVTGLTVIYPNGNEIVSGTISIEWSGAVDSWDHGVTYSVYYSNNSGATWHTIIENIVDTTYNWNTLTASDGLTYTVKVIASCSEGLTDVDLSDSYFIVRNSDHTLSQITLLSPNGGETLSGTTTIEWTEVTDSWFHTVTYGLYYSSDGGTNWILISASVSSTSLIWDTNNANDGSTLIKVVASCSDVLTSEDVSDQTFVIDNNQVTSSSSISTSSSSSTATNGQFDLIGPAIIVIVITASGSAIGYVAYRRTKRNK